MTEVPTLQNWSIDADEDHVPVLVGTVDGTRVCTAPVQRLSLELALATLADGTVVQLGTPAGPVDHAETLALPRAAQQRRLEHAIADLERLRLGERPSPVVLASAPQLDAWSLGEHGGHAILTGIVQGHPRLGDGDWIHTSPLVWLCPDRTAARTISRWYRLGRSLKQHLSGGTPEQ